jgi:hypothetical protein
MPGTGQARFSQAANPFSRAVKSIACWVACCSAHSFPFTYTQTENGAQAVVLIDAVVADREVVVVGEDRLAAIDEVGMTVRAAAAPPAPHAGLLLADADHHHPEAPLGLGALEMLAGDLLPDIAHDKPHHRDLVLATNRLICSTLPRPILPSSAGDGIENPRSKRNRITTCPRFATGARTPARPTGPPIRTSRVTWSASRLEIVATGGMRLAH